MFFGNIDTGTLSCTQLSCSSVVDTGGLTLSGSITLPTANAVVPPTGCVGNIITGPVTAQSVAVSTVVCLCTINLTPRVWSVTSNIFPLL